MRLESLRSFDRKLIGLAGTGIFNSPSTVMRGTRSVGVTLLFWAAGAVYTVAGAHLNIEFGLSTPRHEFEGVEQGIPRSGGTLNYVSLPPTAFLLTRIQRSDF